MRPASLGFLYYTVLRMLTTIARWAVLIPLFAIAFLPLYVANDLFFPYITGKGFAFRILVELAFGAYVLLAILDAKYRPRFSVVLALLSAFVAWMAVADAFGVNPVKAFWSNFERMDGWVTLIHLLAFVLTLTVLSVERRWKYWWLTFISVAAVVCGYGILQLMGAAEIHQGGVRVDATFGNAIYLAVYLMFAFAVTVWQAIESRGAARWWLVLLAVVELVILFATSTRGVVLGLAGGITLSAVLWLVELWREGKLSLNGLPARLALASLGALLVFGGTLYVARDSAFVQSEPTLARLSTVFSLSKELTVRSTIWGMGVKGAMEQPVTGWGQEGFSQVFNKYYEPSLYAQEAWFDRAHNEYIDWLVAGGVPALVLFVLLLVSVGVAFYRDRTASRAERVLFLGLLFAYAIQAIVVFDNLFSYIPLAALIAMAHARTSRQIPTLQRLPVATSEGATAGVTVAALVTTLVVVWLVNVPNIAAANHLVYAVSPLPQSPKENLTYFTQAIEDGSFASQEISEQFVGYVVGLASMKEVPRDLLQTAFPLAVNEMEKEIDRYPSDARIRMQLASAYHVMGEYQLALDQIDAALALSPKKQILHLKRGVELWELGRGEEAKQALRTAYELDTSFSEIAVSAAAGQIIGGDLAGGKELLMDALGTTTLDSDALFYAYYQAKSFGDLVLVAQERIHKTNTADAHYRLVQAYAAAGRFPEARLELAHTMANFPASKSKGEALMKEIGAVSR